VLVLPRCREVSPPFHALMEHSIQHADSEALPGSAPAQAAASRNLLWWCARGEELLAALAYMHKCQVAHCDLKPSNVLQDPRTGALMISDLGLAKLHASTAWIPARTGTDLWRAKELRSGRGGHPMPADVFGAGSVLYQLLRRVVENYPFEDHIYMDRAYCPNDIRAFCRSLAVHPLTAVRPLDQPNFTTVAAVPINHASSAVIRATHSATVSHSKLSSEVVPFDWLVELESLLCAMLSDEPAHRPTADAALGKFQNIKTRLRHTCQRISEAAASVSNSAGSFCFQSSQSLLTVTPDSPLSIVKSCPRFRSSSPRHSSNTDLW